MRGAEDSRFAFPNLQIEKKQAVSVSVYILFSCLFFFNGINHNDDAMVNLPKDTTTYILDCAIPLVVHLSFNQVSETRYLLCTYLSSSRLCPDLQTQAQTVPNLPKTPHHLPPTHHIPLF